MIPYIIIILLLLVLVYYYDTNSTQRGKREWVAFICLVLTIFAGLRYNVGSDTANYEAIFNYSPNLHLLFSNKFWWLEREPLWRLLNSIIRTFTDNFIWFQLIISFIINYLLYTFLLRTTDKIFTAYLIIFCVCWWNFNFEILREAVCVVLYLHSILILFDRKYIKYIIISLILISIHRFAFIPVLMTPLLFFINRRVVLTVMGILAVLVFVFVDESMITTVIISISEELNEASQQKMLYYLESKDEGFHSVNFNGMIEAILLSIALPIYTITCKKRIATKYDDAFLILTIIYVIFSLLKLKMSIMSRICNYYVIILIVGVVNSLYHSINFKMKPVYVALVIIYILMGCYNFYTPNYNSQNDRYNTNYIPYTSVLNPNKEDIR